MNVLFMSIGRMVVGLLLVCVIGAGFFRAASARPNQAQTVGEALQQMRANGVSAETPLPITKNNNQSDVPPHERGVGHIHPESRFTPNNGDAEWPPQQKNIENVIWYTTTATASRQAQVSQDEAAALIAANDPAVQAVLGSRFVFINSAEITEKWQDTPQSHHIVTYFSYSNNTTIEITVNNGAIDAIETMAAADYQPPLRDSEVQEAITIARAYWLNAGNSRIDALQGYTIQTFPTELSATPYFDTRMTYVSFHIDEVSLPELLTWVDLTTQTVIRAEIDARNEAEVE